MLVMETELRLSTRTYEGAMSAWLQRCVLPKHYPFVLYCTVQSQLPTSQPASSQTVMTDVGATQPGDYWTIRTRLLDGDGLRLSLSSHAVRQCLKAAERKQRKPQSLSLPLPTNPLECLLSLSLCLFVSLPYCFVVSPLFLCLI